MYSLVVVLSRQLIEMYNMNLVADQVFRGSKLNSSRLKDEDDDNVQDDVCKAVIPWVPSHTLNPLPEIQTEVSDSMEADEIEASTMEIENAKCLSLVNFCMKTCIW